MKIFKSTSSVVINSISLVMEETVPAITAMSNKSFLFASSSSPLTLPPLRSALSLPEVLCLPHIKRGSSERTDLTSLFKRCCVSLNCHSMTSSQKILQVKVIRCQASTRRNVLPYPVYIYLWSIQAFKKTWIKTIWKWYQSYRINKIKLIKVQSMEAQYTLWIVAALEVDPTVCIKCSVIETLLDKVQYDWCDRHCLNNATL